MTAVVKKKIVEKLARFTKDLKPSDISLSFLTGKAVLQKIELNADFLTEIFHLPPCLQISRVVCDLIKADVPFTSLGTNPIQIMINKVEVEVASCDGVTPRTKQFNDLKLGNSHNSPSTYGYVDKVVDGMKVSIHAVVLRFKDPTFEGSLEVSNVVIQSTTPQWKVSSHLKDTRFKNEEEDYVIVYKMCSWDSVKMEGVSLPNTGQDKLRLVSQETFVRLALKRRISDCSVVHSRVSIHLGDLLCILTQSQLRATSLLIQRLTESSLHMEEEEEEEEKEGKKASSNTKNHPKAQKQSTPHPSIPATPIQAYQDGKLNLSPYLVIQDSFHLKCGKIDLHLDDDLVEQAHQNAGRMNIVFERVMLDMYPDQAARSGHHHWNRANDLIKSNVKWSAEMLGAASKGRDEGVERDVFVSLGDLREMGVVLRCAEFAINAVRKKVLPLITSDKATFKIPDDDDNPAIQMGITLYSYPRDKAGKFLVPRPNAYIYMSPIHVNVHQESILWLAEFIHGVIATVNVDLAKTAVEEGNAYLKSRKSTLTVAEQKQVGVDLKFRLLFSKITLPIPDVRTDGRPKALQIETSSIEISNCALCKVVEDKSFRVAMEWLRKGWVFKTHFSKEFPHFAGDFEPFCAGLSTVLRNHFPDKSHPQASLHTDARRKLDLMSVEVWQVETACVSVSFPESYSHDATLRPKQFVHDFPLRLWLFPPPLGGAPTTPAEPVYPKVSFLLHLPQPLHVTLERLQFLFLLDVKESFRNFQSMLIQLLTLGNRSSLSPSGNRSPLSEPNISNPSTTTFSITTATSTSTTDTTTTDTNTTDTMYTFTDTTTDTITTKGNDSGTQSFKDSASMGGCIVINTVNVEIMLPTLFGSGSPEVEQRSNVAASETEMFMELDSKAKEDSAPLRRPSSMTSLLASGDKLVESSASSSPFPDDHTPDMQHGTTNLKRTSSSTSILSSSQAASSPFGSTANLSAQHEGQDDEERPGDLHPLSEDTISVADSVCQASDQTLPPSFTQNSISSSQTSISSSHVFVSPLQSSIPPPQGSIPPSQGSIPPSQGSIPPSQGSIPPSQGSIPPSQGSIPPSQGSIPPSQGSIPPSQGSIAPSQVSIAPSQVSIAPLYGSIPPPQGSIAPSQGSIPPSQTFTSPPQTFASPSKTSIPPVIAPAIAPASTHVSSTSTAQVTKATTGTHPTPTLATPMPPAPWTPTSTHASVSMQTPLPSPSSSSRLLPASNNPKPPPSPSVFTEDSDFVLIAADPLSSSASVQLPTKQEQDAYPQQSTPRVSTVVMPATSASSGCVKPPPPSQGGVMPPPPSQASAQSMMNKPLAPLAPQMDTPPGLDPPSTPTGSSPSLATLPGSVPPVGQISSDTNSGPPAISNSDLSSQTDIAPDTISVSTETSSSNYTKPRVPKPPIHGKTQGYVAPPPYILLIHVENACLLPNITPKGISLRGSVDYVELEEAKVGHRPRNGSPVPSDSPDECVPIVKIRFELGDRVGDLFPGTLPPPKTAAMIKVDGLDASFWVPNLTYLKDFFEDEYVTDEPLPMHVRVDNTSVVLRDSAGDTADNPHSMRIQVHGVCVHRGPRLEGVNVFVEDSAPASEEERVAEGNGEGNGLLKEMFKSFISVFDAHIQKFGEVKLPYANHIAGLLYQLKSSLSGEPPSEEQTDTVSVAHPRWYKMSSVQTELQRLRKENENLSKYEEENRRLTQQLVDVMAELVKIKSDNTWLVSEVRAKQELVLTYKQLIEKQHAQIENLVSDRDNLTAGCCNDTQAQSLPR